MTAQQYGSNSEQPVIGLAVSIIDTAGDLDRTLYRASRLIVLNETAKGILSHYSKLGERFQVWVPLALVGATADRRRCGRWLRATAAVTAAWLLNEVTKRIVRRRRPDLPDCPPLSGGPDRGSFPSSHATTSFAAARAFGPLIGRVPLYGFATTLSLARVALGAHYPSDLLAGIVLGLLTGRFGTRT